MFRGRPVGTVRVDVVRRDTAEVIEVHDVLKRGEHAILEEHDRVPMWAW